MFFIAIAAGILIGTLYDIFIESITPSSDSWEGSRPMKYNDDIGYQVGLFLCCGLSLVYSFYKIKNTHTHKHILQTSTAMERVCELFLETARNSKKLYRWCRPKAKE